jgi:hypothetical protein
MWRRNIAEHHTRETTSANATLQRLARDPRTLLHLDTTYCAPQHVFLEQAPVIAHVVRACEHALSEGRSGAAALPLFVFGAYTIGTERVFMEVRCCCCHCSC